MDKLELSKELLRIRQKKGLTQIEIQKLSSLTAKQIVYIEKGTKNFTIDSLFKYLDAIESNIHIK